MTGVARNRKGMKRKKERKGEKGVEKRNRGSNTPHRGSVKSV